MLMPVTFEMFPDGHEVHDGHIIEQRVAEWFPEPPRTADPRIADGGDHAAELRVVPRDRSPHGAESLHGGGGGTDVCTTILEQCRACDRHTESGDALVVVVGAPHFNGLAGKPSG